MPERSVVSWTAMISGYTQNGKILFLCVKANHCTYGSALIPRVEHFSCVVDMFDRKGWFEEGYNLIGKMNIKPNASLWDSVRGACSIYGNMSVEVATTSLFDMDAEKSVNYVVLASIYAKSGGWDDALKTRKLIKQRSLKKYPGCNLFQTKDQTIELLQPN
ncbi:PPR domain-containing protein [Cephalotus follicularis]|uniref:PPR domain-containing protein n=1 Tax=Cephalotus follicularis TaxID=3775 RepID=A0A1Q3CPH9_CEPFO|nr:PPR domain-containing protein [Cephalotus follicularis]